MKTYHKRRLPHIQPIGATFFVTWNLEGAIPRTALDEMKRVREDAIRNIENNNKFSEEEKKVQRFQAKWDFFKNYDTYLDKPGHESPQWLKDPSVAKVVADRIHEFNGRYYDLIAFCIMSNHVHLLFDFSIQIPKDGSSLNGENYKQLWQVIKLIRGASSAYANRLLGRVGKRFWQEEYFDRFIRNDTHLWNATQYTIMNPVKAGLCGKWGDYPFTWLKEGGIHSAK